AVLVDGDHDRDDRAGFALRLRVERLAELHDVDAVLAQRRANRRGGAGLPGVRLQLDRGENLLCHLELFDLVEADLDGRLATEDGYQDLEARSVLVDLRSEERR